MENKKIKLYHFSNQDFKGKLLPKFYGQNSYTFNDTQACNTPRLFFYLKNEAQEFRFKNSTYLYIAEISKNKLYDLRLDRKKLLSKITGINNLINAIKKLGYNGIIYETGGLVIANTFNPQKINQKINLQKRGA